MPGLHAMRCFTILAGLAAAGAAQADTHLTMTKHVPDAVLNQSAAPAGPMPADEVMELAISLPLRNEAGLKALLAQIYDPASPAYRHYLSVADFAARFSPTEAEYKAVRQFASAHNLLIRNDPANRRVLDVSGKVADVEQAFNVKIGLYKHPTENRYFYAPDREPATDLDTPVLHISGLDNFTLPFNHLVQRQAGQAVAHRVATGSGPDGNFYGSDVRVAYYGHGGLTGAGQSLGLLEFKGYNIADVDKYFAVVGEPFNVPVVGVSVNGQKLVCSGTCDDSEQVLDMEEAVSMAPGLTELVVYVGKTDVSILNQMAVDNNCAQLSSSWGWEVDPDADEPIFEEFAAQGQSFLDATGDNGYHLKKGAVWPGDDQWVTGVGGTDLVTEGPGKKRKKETGWVLSGGGVTPDGIAIPAYQLPFVTEANQASSTLRNVPDIAGDANTDNFSCWDGGCFTGWGGTSYAAPLFTGFVALANQQSALDGKGRIGFLNPTIYKLAATPFYAKAFHDEIRGQNGKYHAEIGYDLVTGFGSPHSLALVNGLITGR